MVPLATFTTPAVKKHKRSGDVIIHDACTDCDARHSTLAPLRDAPRRWEATMEIDEGAMCRLKERVNGPNPQQFAWANL
jgi:hypothetical protein